MPKYTMSDGRHFTQHVSSSDYMNFLMKKYKHTDTNKFRTFMQKNSERILKDMDECDKDPKDCKYCPVCRSKIKMM